MRRDGSLVAADVVVHDEDTIRRIDAGELAELSVGYLAEMDETPGTTPEGEKYDAVQRRITGNHVALLPKGVARAGSVARLRLDSNEEITMTSTEAADREDADDELLDEFAASARSRAFNAGLHRPAATQAREDAGDMAHARAMAHEAWRADWHERQMAERGAAAQRELGSPFTPGTEAAREDAGRDEDELDEFAAMERSAAFNAALTSPRARGGE